MGGGMHSRGRAADTPRPRRFAQGALGRPARVLCGVGVWWLLVVWCVAGGMGLVFMRNVGALSAPDPDLHVPTAYALATGQSFARTVVVEDVFGNRVRRPVIRGDDRYLTGLVAYNRTLTAASADPLRRDPDIDAQRRLLTREPLELQARPRATQYTPVAYLPQALGLRLAWGRGSDPYTALQYSRLMNLASYLLMAGIAVALAPRGRPLLALAACLPASCYAASSVTTDGLFLAAVMLLVSLAMRAAEQRERMGIPTLTAICILSGFLILGKALYASCLLLVVALPRSVLPRRRRTVFLTWCMACLTAYLWWTTNYSGGYYNAGQTANAAHVLAHPLRGFTLLAANMLFLPRTLLAPTVASLGATLLILAAWLHALNATRPHGTADGNGPRETVPQEGDPSHTGGHMPEGMHTAIARVRASASRDRYRIMAGLAALAALAMIVGFVALTWNDLTTLDPTGAIQGIQGRYLLPLLPLLASTLTTHHDDTTPTRPRQEG